MTSHAVLYASNLIISVFVFCLCCGAVWVFAEWRR